MKILKTMICAALLVAGLCACEKIDVNKLEGTWTEQYDPAVFAMDGSVEYTFDGNGRYQLHVYDALSGESHDYTGTYAIDLVNKGTITFDPQMSDYSSVTYKLVKLTSQGHHTSVCLTKKSCRTKPRPHLPGAGADLSESSFSIESKRN